MNVKISIDLLRVNGAQWASMMDANGKECVGVFVPREELFCPEDKTQSAHLLATMVETPSNPFKEFGIKPHITKARYDAMNETERRNIPFIGSGSYIKQEVPQEVKQAAVSVAPNLQAPK